ncbi:MAG TPA: periplasmic heavy metal sensor [Chroococcales cyanobacterium]
MEIRKALLTLLVALVGLAPALPALAEKGDGMQGMKSTGQYWQKFDLSKEQQAKVESIEKSYREKLKNARAQVVARMKEWMDLYQNAKVDDATLRKAHEKVEEARREMMKVHVDYEIAVRDVLTPAQRAKYAEEKTSRVDRSKHMKRRCEMCGME